MIDLMQATQDAVFAALSAAIPPELASIHVHVKQDTRPPLIFVGEIATENEAAKGGQFERIEFHIEAIYRGGDRGVLLSMMHASRAALDDADLAAVGVAFDRPRFLAAATDRAVADDGVTYIGVSRFEVYAEPA